MSFVNILKGALIGVALVIPGLSGSIFAVVVGLYEDIIFSINSIMKKPRESARFLWPVAAGAVAGILLSTKGILWVCEAYPVQSYLFFTGLVLGSAPLVIRKINGIKFNPMFLFLTFFTFGAILYLTEAGGMGSGAESYIAIDSLGSAGDFMDLLFAGLFSVSLMAIPGVSGSVMLMVINRYGTVYNAVGAVIDLMNYLIRGEMASAADALATVLLVAPFMIGACIGLVVIAKALGYLLNRFEALVYYGVLGLLAGAVVVLIKTGVLGNLPQMASGSGRLPLMLAGTVCVAVGFLCTLFLDRPE